MGSGRCPVKEFLDSVEELDLVPARYFKKLVGSEDIWEVRVQIGGNIFRILGFLDGAELVVLNHDFQKKTQKTPPKEIRTAEKRKRDYLARKES